MGAAVRLYRSAATIVLFAVFALGGAAVSVFIMPFLRGRESGQRLIRRLWRRLVRLFKAAGLISVDDSLLKETRGRIIVANHPSLIDVVILTAVLPDVYSFAKKSLERNPFFGSIVRKVMIPNDAHALEKAAGILSGGGNILIFPEGTRTPLAAPAVALKRGAAQLAIRLSVPVAPVRIEMTRRILAKNQPVSDMGDGRVGYRLISLGEITPPPVSAVNRRSAVSLTKEIERALFPERTPALSAGFKCRRCGACCRIDGFVRIGEEDISAISAFLGMSESDFIARETVLSPDRASLALKDGENGACAMLGENGLCRIYPVRPEKCRTFPFKWTNPGSSQYCPGLAAVAGKAL